MQPEFSMKLKTLNNFVRDHPSIFPVMFGKIPLGSLEEVVYSKWLTD